MSHRHVVCGRKMHTHCHSTQSSTSLHSTNAITTNIGTEILIFRQSLFSYSTFVHFFVSFIVSSTMRFWFRDRKNWFAFCNFVSNDANARLENDGELFCGTKYCDSDLLNEMQNRVERPKVHRASKRKSQSKKGPDTWIKLSVLIQKPSVERLKLRSGWKYLNK